MQKVFRWFKTLSLLAGFLQLAACSAPPPDPAVPGAHARNLVVQRLTAVVVTNRKVLSGSASGRLVLANMAGDTDGGSATPIAPDGYFLTADHVLAQAQGRRVFVIYRNGGNVRHAQARIVWSSGGSDLAILHAPISTPYYYRWSSSDKWAPAGTKVIHGGLATGFRSPSGRLTTGLPPEGILTRARTFKFDIPLRPGDSGGPVIDAQGNLLGINSAVEYLVPMETAFFIDSESTRPSVRALEGVISRDRRSHGRGE
jgi:S1-C subfamily serine protease